MGARGFAHPTRPDRAGVRRPDEGVGGGVRSGLRLFRSADFVSARTRLRTNTRFSTKGGGVCSVPWRSAWARCCLAPRCQPRSDKIGPPRMVSGGVLPGPVRFALPRRAPALGSRPRSDGYGLAGLETRASCPARVLPLAALRSCSSMRVAFGRTWASQIRSRGVLPGSVNFASPRCGPAPRCWSCPDIFGSSTREGRGVGQRAVRSASPLGRPASRSVGRSDKPRSFRIGSGRLFLFRSGRLTSLLPYHLTLRSPLFASGHMRGHSASAGAWKGGI